MAISMLHDPVVIGQEPHRDSDRSLVGTVLDHINEQAVIGLDTLVCLLPQYSWNQIFQAVDDLARQKLVVLRRHGFEYSVFSIHYAA